MSKNIYALAVMAIALSSCFQKGNDQFKGYVSYVQKVHSVAEKGEGADAPDFSWYDKSGKEVSFRKMTQGKVVVVNFWATWCGPCKRELPDLRAINSEYAQKGVLVLGIATMERTEPAYRLDFVSKFVHERDLGYPIVLDNDSLDMWRAFAMDPKSGALPATILIDRNGRIAKAFIGVKTEEEFEAELKPLL
jgi:peroxiredoxin